MMYSGLSTPDEMPTFGGLSVDLARPKVMSLRSGIAVIVASFVPCFLFDWYGFELTAIFCFVAAVLFFICFAPILAADHDNASKVSQFPWILDLDGIVADLAILPPKGSYARRYEVEGGRGILVESKVETDDFYSSLSDRLYFTIRFSDSAKTDPSIMSGVVTYGRHHTLRIDAFDHSIGKRAIDAGSLLVDALRRELAATRVNGEFRREQIDKLLTVTA